MSVVSVVSVIREQQTGGHTLAEHRGPYFYGTGRRKTAVARVRLYPNGNGQYTIVFK